MKGSPVDWLFQKYSQRQEVEHLSRASSMGLKPWEAEVMIRYGFGSRLHPEKAEDSTGSLFTADAPATAHPQVSADAPATAHPQVSADAPATAHPQVSADAPVSVLDIGCGGGREAIPLARKGYSVTAIDLIPEMVRMAEATAGSEGVRIVFQVGNAWELPFPDGTFDLCLLVEQFLSLVPLPDLRKKTMGEACRVVKKGGRVVGNVLSRHRGFFRSLYWKIHDPAVAHWNRKIGPFLSRERNQVQTGEGDRLVRNIDGAPSDGKVIIHYFSEEEIRELIMESRLSLIHLERRDPFWIFVGEK